MSETRASSHHVALSGEPAMDASMVGAVLGSYRITSALSAGGMGMVYRAQHELLDRPAAIKLLRPELTASAELVQRFVNEAKAATAIRHPGIVEVYDFGYTEDGHAYLVMELLDGDPLGRRLAARGRMSEPEALAIARGIASALEAAHGKGIVHRDLKPDNIFLVRDPEIDGGERIKVLDFGVAKLVDASPADRYTRTGVLMGTPRYMAPEQAREAAAIDHRADLYSLGCILYELVVGAPPFVAEGAGEIIALQLFTAPEPPSQRASISPGLEALVLRLLAKEPAERPASAHEVVHELARLAGHASGPVAVPAAPRPRAIDAAPRATVRRAGERAMLPVVAAVVTLLLVGVAIVVVVRARGGAASGVHLDAGPAPVAAPVVTAPAAPAAPTAATPGTAATTAPAAAAAATPTPPPPPDEPVVIESGDAPRAPARPSPKRPPRPTEDGTTGRVAPVRPKGPTTENGSPIEVQLEDTQKEP